MVVKGFSLLAFFTIILFGLGEYPGWYSMGWVTGSSQRYFNPFTELAAIFICLPLLLGCWIVSLFLRRHRLWTTTILAGAVLSYTFLFLLLPPPGCMTIYGIRDHVMKVATLDDLRNLAREIDKNPIDLDENTVLDSGDTLKRLRPLQQRYPFLAWGIGGHGNPYVSVTDDILKIEWGGALPGHWGFCVAANGVRITPPADPDLRVIRMSDDIYFYDGD
jgi:hypothetical protein